MIFAVPVQNRIGLSWVVFAKNKALPASSHLLFKTKVKVYNAYILPVLLYGLVCINWTVTLLKGKDSRITSFPGQQSPNRSHKDTNTS